MAARTRRAVGPSRAASADVKTVVTLDAGEPNDLHPHDKKLVASRLFDAACALLYGGDNVQPMVERIEERDGMLCVSYATVARKGPIRSLARR